MKAYLRDIAEYTYVYAHKYFTETLKRFSNIHAKAWRLLRRL